MPAPVNDKQVAEWLYETGRLVGVENYEAWFEVLHDSEKARYRQEFAGRPRIVSAKTLASEWFMHCDEVKIERRRSSTTQGEFSIHYQGEEIARFGDDIRLTGERDGAGAAIWTGLSDDTIMQTARRLYQFGDQRLGLAPLYHREIIAAVRQGSAVAVSDEEWQAIRPVLANEAQIIFNVRRVGTEDSFLVGHPEVLSGVDPLEYASYRMTRLVDALALKYPEAGLSFGYIGNCDVRGQQDDRSWRVFTRVSMPTAGQRYDWGNHATNRLAVMADLAEQSLENWVRCVAGLDPWPQQARGRVLRGNTGMGM